MPTTASDLWDEYRATCCPDECGEALHWQRLAFISGIVAACGTIAMGAACNDLGLSGEEAYIEAIDDFQAEQAELN